MVKNGKYVKWFKERSGAKTPLHLAKSGLETNLVEINF
jgi:hypothetical protein